MLIAVALVATQVPRLRIAVLHPSWWTNRIRNRPRRFNPKTDWVAVQVAVLIGLICGAVTIGWMTRAGLERLGLITHSALFSILLVTVSFVGVAIACWTSLPQIAAITEAREQVEQTLDDLQRTQTQLVQAEKMSSLGQLVAGVAHEPGQLNQVVMNIVANEIDALEEKLAKDGDSAFAPQITLRTTLAGKDWVEVAIADNGPGMPPEVQNRIF
ncbi:MAG: hypothetical protein IGR92_01710, partial [Leptolyngbyaceae cyanobacterium T60_A2020_046]|nr:hypothetical protein [Leptolyngbyaceae cyanobacterium T60_A2020_046]